jgi:hypothetical protein
MYASGLQTYIWNRVNENEALHILKPRHYGAFSIKNTPLCLAMALPIQS